MQLFYSNLEVITEKHYVKDYGTFKEITIFNALERGFSPLDVKVSSAEEKERVSSARIKSKIRDYALMNNFTHFFTQTCNNFERYDLNLFKKTILSKFKAYKRINRDFIYLIIFEKHKDGAFHLHGLVGGLGVDLRKNSYGYDTLEFFTDIGFNSLSLIRNKNKVSNYITKYISKDICKSASGVSYFHSKGLLLPTTYETHIDDFSSLQLIFQNAYLKKFIIKKV